MHRTRVALGLRTLLFLSLSNDQICLPGGFYTARQTKNQHHGRDSYAY